MSKKTILHTLIFILTWLLVSCVEKEESEDKSAFETKESIDEIILGDGKRY